MLITCGFCGADLTAGAECGCRRPLPARPARSHLHDVVRTAVALGEGRVTETTLAQAARALEERAS